MTAAQYIDGLARLAELQPAHPLLPMLRERGHNRLTEAYLAQCLKATTKEQQKQTFDFENEEEADDPVDDERLRLMRVELRRLFHERNMLSDRFHDLKTVKERAYNSEEIQIVQRNIGKLMARIRHYRVHGEMPPGDDGGFYVPADGLNLAKQRNSLRANLSRKRKEVRELRESDLDDQATMRKIEKGEQQILDLLGKLKQVDEAIKNIQQQ